MVSLVLGFTLSASAADDDDKDKDRKEKFKWEAICNCDWDLTLQWTKHGKPIGKPETEECGSGKKRRTDRFRETVEKPDDADDIEITIDLDNHKRFRNLFAHCELGKDFGKHLERFHADCSVDRCFIKTDVVRQKSRDRRDSLEEETAEE
jgi:hypothetical protein